VGEKREREKGIGLVPSTTTRCFEFFSAGLARSPAGDSPPTSAQRMMDRSALDLMLNNEDSRVGLGLVSQKYKTKNKESKQDSQSG